MLTISWQPGALKGMTQAQTNSLIIGSCQMWQKVCGVRFATMPFGHPTTITVYPWSKPMNGAMVAYPATRQILYSTLTKMTPQWARMAFAHEIGHCFGWGHSPNNRPEDLMFWKGSSVLYFAAQEARRARNRFGNPSHRYRPESIDLVKSQITVLKDRHRRARAEHKPQIQKEIDLKTVQLKRLQAEWKSIGDPHFASESIVSNVCECFGEVGLHSNNWENVFHQLREEECSFLKNLKILSKPILVPKS